MINTVIDLLARKVIAKGVCNEADYDVLFFVLSSWTGRVISFSALLIIGILMDSLLEMITYAVFLLLLRGQTSGYHAKTHLGCACLSCLIGAIAVMISRIHWEVMCLFSITSLLISAIYIIGNAPINHVNIDLSDEEKQCLKKTSAYYLAAELIIIWLLIILHISSIAITASMAVISNAFFMGMAKIQHQEVKK